MNLCFLKKIRESLNNLSIRNTIEKIIKFSGSVDNGNMKSFNVKRPSERTSIFLTSLLVFSLLFLLFNPKSTKLTAAGPEKPVRAKETDNQTVAEPVKLERISTELKRGGTLQNLLLNAGISLNETNGIISALAPLMDLTRLKSGQKFDIFFDDKYVHKIVIPASIDKDIQIEKVDDQSFKAEEILKELIVYPMKKSSVVESSLYGSAVAAGIPDAIIMDLIMLYSFDVDFQRDIQPGDELSAVFELVYDESGKIVDTGIILNAELKTDGREIKIFRYTSADGKTDYYNEQGHTVRKSLLKTPINGAYITSNYGMRTNPFSGYNTMHKGVDFGAPRGTAIKASGDGTVVAAGYNDVYGNYIKIRHVNHYETLYAHQTSFARGIKRGTKVEQGQVIGYVGSTGMSTGPHLHYEVRYYGKQVNPSTVKFPPGRTLNGDDLRLYSNQIQSFQSSFY